MGKNKLAKFADMATYPHVFEAPDIITQDGTFAMKGKWAEDFFKNDNPIILELGCGRGEYTVNLARMFPDKNFIGVDIKGSRMWTGATHSLNEGLKNVAFLRTNIEFIERFFGKDEVAEIWLTFSDPQFKKPTKRLTSSYFLERYARFLKPKGIINLKTDSNFLFTYTEHVARCNSLPVTLSTSNLYDELAGGNFGDESLRKTLDIKTYYESQWLERGITIKYIRFSLDGKTAFAEPNVEIEIDDYRSYKRQKRTPLTMAK